MKIFKELNKLGYIHYSATTIEELDDLPLNSAERISEQALVFEWFREKHGLHSYIDEWKLTTGELVYDYVIVSDDIDEEDDSRKWKTVKEAQLACLIDLISIVKTKKL